LGGGHAGTLALWPLPCGVPEGVAEVGIPFKRLSGNIAWHNSRFIG
jgi:hypothetical protein